MAILVQKATDAQKEEFKDLRERAKDVGTSEWFYDEKTICLFTQGRALVDHYGEKVPVEAGDLVTIPQGVQCQWEVLEPIRVKVKN
jgi:uncharacterized cupin superfamily protein